MESGLLVRTGQGTPQGGNLSPMLANIFFHYVLDLWFYKRARVRVRGQCYMVRYADDFVCMVQYRQSADELERMLRERFAQFGLSLHPQKTRTISFGRYEQQNAKSQKRKANTFDFLGFTHYCGQSRTGVFLLGRKTSSGKFRKACRQMNIWLRQVRSEMSIRQIWRQYSSKLQGHYNYYGVSGNSRKISDFGYVSIRMLHKWLNRRGQNRVFTWEQLNGYRAYYPLPRPRIVHNFYQPLYSRRD